MAINTVLQAVAETLRKMLPPEASIDGPLDDGTSFTVMVALPGRDLPMSTCRVSLTTQGRYRYDHTRPQADVKNRIAVQPYYPHTLAGKRFAVANVEKAAAYALEATNITILNDNTKRSRQQAAETTMAPFQKFLQSRMALQPLRYGGDQLRFSNPAGDPPLDGILSTNGTTMSLHLSRMSPETARLILTAIAAALEEPQDVPDLF